MNFTLEEAVASETASRDGIDNTPSSDVITVMTQTASHMEIVRSLLANPVHVNSWFRCERLNSAIGSKSTSQHILGEAVDFICPQFGTPLDICRKILWNGTIPFDQMILEHTWVHISFSISLGKPRHQVLSLLSTGGYAGGLTDSAGNQL